MTDNPKAGQEWYRTASAVVREVIHEWDPYSLLAGGAPDDEFHSEIASIVAQIPRIAGKNDAVHAVSRVFSSAFEPERFGLEDCQSVGRELYLRLSNANLLDPP